MKSAMRVKACRSRFPVLVPESTTRARAAFNLRHKTCLTGEPEDLNYTSTGRHRAAILLRSN